MAEKTIKQANWDNNYEDMMATGANALVVNHPKNDPEHVLGGWDKHTALAGHGIKNPNKLTPVRVGYCVICLNHC